MGFGGLPPQRIERGDPVPSGWLRSVGQSVVQRLTVTGGVAKRHGTNISISVQDDVSLSDFAVSGFVVQTELADSLECLEVTSSGTGAITITIAKPPNLRGDVATRTEGGEAQEIWPAYAGATVYAVKPSNGTGVDMVVWLDLNTDARVWATDC